MLHKLELAKKSFNSTFSAQLISKNEELKNNIKNCSEEITEKEIKLEKLIDEMEKTKKDANEVATDKG